MTLAPILPERREWTVDDLAELPSDLNYELINGRLVLPSPTVTHQEVCGQVWLALREQCPPELIAVLDLSLKIDRRNEPRPDVVVIRLGHVDVSPVPVDDAVLAVEVLSPSSAFRDVTEKGLIYARAGVQYYWVVDALRDKVMLIEFRRGDSGAFEPMRDTTDVFETEEPWPIRLDLPALTERRDTLLGRA